MIRINLLPFRAARKSENIRRQVSLFLLSLTLLFLLMGYSQISLSAKVSELNQQVQTTSNELTKYKKKAAEVDEIKKKLDGLQKRTDVVRELDKNRKAPVILLDTMTQVVVPNRMWLTAMKDTGATVDISGVALDNKTTADFMTRLENSELFSSVNLKTVQHQVQDNQKMKKFEISCTKASNDQTKK